MDKDTKDTALGVAIIVVALPFVLGILAVEWLRTKRHLRRLRAELSTERQEMWVE